MSDNPESKLKDLYTGELICAWEDDDAVNVSFFPNGVTLFFLKEHWESIKTELDELINGEHNHHPAG